jgi:hypothetical protein
MLLGITAAFALYHSNYGIPKRSLSNPRNLTMLELLPQIKVRDKYGTRQRAGSHQSRS